MRHITIGLLASTALAAPAAAQGLLTSFITDSAGDAIWLCQDLNQNGHYNDAGEINQFYDEGLGAFSLSSNQALLWRPDGSLFVSDSTEDFILELADQNADLDANDPGEAKVWFNGDPAQNASGITMAVARGMWLDGNGVLWVASGNAGGSTPNPGEDVILRLEDKNADGDANDLDEAEIYFEALPGAALGDSIPVDVIRGFDGALYMLDAGVSMSRPKGVYRLEDLDNSGAIDAPGEETTFFLVPPTGSSVFHWSLQQDDQGRMYLADTSGDVIWRFQDSNGDGSIDSSTEAEVVWTAPGSSNIWSFQVVRGNELYVAEDQTPDRLLRMFDTNSDGVFDAVTETETIYDETVSPTNIGSPRGIALAPAGQFIGLGYCDPAVINSTGNSGVLTAFGTQFANANNVTLLVEGLPSGEFGFFLNGTGNNVVNMPGGSAGNLCVSTSIGRYNGAMEIFQSGTLGTGSLVLDLANTPTPMGPVAIQAGETWYFQCWYRDTPGVTSNFTNGLEIQFQ